MRVRYLPGALEDLRSIYDYIFAENPSAAGRVLASIREQNRALLRNPTVGRQGRLEGTRELANSRFPYITAYRIQKNEVQILAVVHSSRRWPESLPR